MIGQRLNHLTRFSKENPISNPDRTQPGRFPGRVIIKPDVAYAT